MDFHLPSSKLTLDQKETYYMAINIYNSLPIQIKETAHDVKWSHIQKMILYPLSANVRVEG
jgi:hypothetical protein